MVKEYIVGIEKWRIRHLLATLVATYFRGKPLPSKGARNFATCQSIGSKIVIIYHPYTPTPCQLLVGLKSEKLREALYSPISTFKKLRVSCVKVEFHKKKWGGLTMKFFRKHRMDHGGVLYDGDNITNMPELEKLKASQKMNKDKTGRIFAAFTRPEEEALAQLIREQK